MLQAKSRTAANKKPDGAALIPTARKTSTRAKRVGVTPEERTRMIAEAAYYVSEKRGFAGDSKADWLEAESQIDRMLLTGSAQTDKHEFAQQFEGRLQDLDARLLQLKSRALKARSELRSDLERQIEALSGKRAEAHGLIEQMRSRTDDAWDDLKGGAEKLWDEMKQALDHLLSRFK